MPISGELATKLAHQVLTQNDMIFQELEDDSRSFAVEQARSLLKTGNYDEAVVLKEIAKLEEALVLELVKWLFVEMSGFLIQAAPEIESDDTIEFHTSLILIAHEMVKKVVNPIKDKILEFTRLYAKRLLAIKLNIIQPNPHFIN